MDTNFDMQKRANYAHFFGAMAPNVVEHRTAPIFFLNGNKYFYRTWGRPKNPGGMVALPSRKFLRMTLDITLGSFLTV